MSALTLQRRIPIRALARGERGVHVLRMRGPIASKLDVRALKCKHLTDAAAIVL